MYEDILGTVIPWKKLWRTLWFPTINCLIQNNVSLDPWTYRVNVVIAWIIYAWIWPWFADRNLFEVHLLHTSQDFYDEEVCIVPLVKIRDNKQFSSLEQLQQQIQKDILRTEEHPQVTITFWTFDYMHPGHEFYLRQARKYGDYLITIVARDTTVKRIKWTLPDHDEDERMRTLTECDYIDIVELGNATDPYTCLREYTPNVICLWYDQHSFDRGLRDRCDSNWLVNTAIIRIPSFHPEQRKSSLIKSVQ